MWCPACQTEYEPTVRTFTATELRPTLTVRTVDTVKTKPNPGYRPPDPMGCRC